MVFYVSFSLLDFSGNSIVNRPHSGGSGEANSSGSPKQKKRTTVDVLAFELCEGR